VIPEVHVRWELNLKKINANNLIEDKNYGKRGTERIISYVFNSDLWDATVL
jgi:hypothetical protein